ncbi:cysteine proteinase, partial [Rozella allomycis CSF55]
YWAEIGMLGTENMSLNLITQKYFRSRDIFEKHQVLIPVNQGNVHWMLAIVYPKEMKIDWFDSLKNFKLEGAKEIQVLSLSLNVEYEAKFGMPNERIWIHNIRDDVPTQNDSYNCGVHVCMTAK